MKRWTLTLVIAVSLLVTPMVINKTLCKDKPEETTDIEEAALLGGTTSAQKEKDALIADVNTMRNQELRVAILQQLLNEEVAKLKQVQAVFCDRHSLSLDKFRTGEYIYDAEKGKFVERSK